MWRAAFMREFADTPGVQRAAQHAWFALKMQPGEAVEQYYARFLKVQRKAVEEGKLLTAAEEDEAAAKFVEGLDEELQGRVAVPGQETRWR